MENENYLEKIPKLLELKKPLIIFDLETTGLIMSTDRIIEIAYLKIFPDGRVIRDDLFLNPEMNITAEASAVHGLKNEDVAMMPKFKEKAAELWEVFRDCYYSGFNVVGFDLPLLKREFLRFGYDFVYVKKDIIDAKQIYHFMEPRTLSAAYKFYCGKEHIDAHSAIADVEVTAEILEKQLETYREVADWEFINKIHTANDDKYVDNERKFYWREGEAYFTFSKFRDQSLESVARTEPGFLNWILTADFSEEVKSIVRKAMLGEFPKK
jgi:DNA polymerase-3 subunit epsilon